MSEYLETVGLPYTMGDREGLQHRRQRARRDARGEGPRAPRHAACASSSRSWASRSGSRDVDDRAPSEVDGRLRAAACRSRSTASASRSLVELFLEANAIGGRHGLGMSDQIENRVIDAKSRGIYEAPGMALLHIAYERLLSRDPQREHARSVRHARPPPRPPALRGQVVRSRGAACSRTRSRAGSRRTSPARSTLELRRGDDYTILATEAEAATYAPDKLSMERSDTLFTPEDRIGALEMQTLSVLDNRALLQHADKAEKQGPGLAARHRPRLSLAASSLASSPGGGQAGDHGWRRRRRSVGRRRRRDVDRQGFGIDAIHALRRPCPARRRRASRSAASARLAVAARRAGAGRRSPPGSPGAMRMPPAHFGDFTATPTVDVTIAHCCGRLAGDLVPADAKAEAGAVARRGRRTRMAARPAADVQPRERLLPHGRCRRRRSRPMVCAGGAVSLPSATSAASVRPLAPGCASEIASKPRSLSFSTLVAVVAVARLRERRTWRRLRGRRVAPFGLQRRRRLVGRPYVDAREPSVGADLVHEARLDALAGDPELLPDLRADRVRPLVHRRRVDLRAVGQIDPAVSSPRRRSRARRRA